MSDTERLNREATAGRILRRSLGAAGVGPSTAASVRRMLATYDDMVQGGDCTGCRGTGKARDREGCAVPCDGCKK